MAIFKSTDPALSLIVDLTKSRWETCTISIVGYRWTRRIRGTSYFSSADYSSRRPPVRQTRQAGKLALLAFHVHLSIY